MNFYYRVIKYDIKVVLMAFVLVSLYVLLDKKRTDRVRIIDVIAAATMVFLSGYRYNVGSDYQSYFRRYTWISNNWLDVKSRMVSEFGFTVLSKITSYFSDNPYAIFWAVALLMYPGLVFIARKYTKRPSIVIATYVFSGFYMMSNNIIRQAIAIHFLLFAFVLWNNKKRFFAVVLAVLAVSFHTSALIGITLIIIAHFIPPRRNLLVAITLGSVGMYMLWDAVFLKIIGGIPIVKNYYNYLVNGSNENIKRAMWLYILFYLVLTFIFINNKALIEKNEIIHCCSITLLSIPLLFAALKVSYAQRIALYLYTYSIFVAPDLWSNSKLLNKKGMAKALLVFIMVLWFSINNIISMDNQYWAYDFQWNHPEVIQYYR